MKKLFSKLVNMIQHPYMLLRARIAYDRAVFKAEESLANTGQRTYVIKARSSGKKQFMLVDRSNFRKLKKLGHINRRATIKSLENYCFYCTSYANGTDEMPADIVTMKRKQALRWYTH